MISKPTPHLVPPFKFAVPENETHILLRDSDSSFFSTSLFQMVPACSSWPQFPSQFQYTF